MMTDEFILTSMQLSSANDDVICNNARINRKSLIYKTKYWCWIFLLILFSKRKKTFTQTIIFATTHVNETKLRNMFVGCDVLSFAKLNNSLSKLRKNYSVLSNKSLARRINLLVKSALFVIRNKKRLPNLPTPLVIEYYFISDFIFNTTFSTVAISANYDRYATLITNLAKYKGTSITGVQDGAVIDIKLPGKLHYDLIFTFGEKEKKAIQKYVDSDNCEYRYIGFTSMLNWSERKTSKAIVAIASQDWLTEKTIEIIKKLYFLLDNEKYEIILYPHYREKLSQYSSLLSLCPNLIVEEKRRFTDIDLLITFFSTIVYDYRLINEQLKVVCLQVNGYKAEYYSDKNVYVVEDIDSLCEMTRKLV